LFVAFVSDALDPLALELGELDAVGGAGDVEVKHVTPGRRANPAGNRGRRTVRTLGLCAAPSCAVPSYIR
jgi:hypothetical protein